MENTAQQPCWYILHTYSGYEAMVKDSLERLIENNNLQSQIFDVKIPMETTIEEKNGKRKLVERKLLPCYVFIKMIYSNQLWYWVTNTRGVTGFVGPASKPIPLTEKEIEDLGVEVRTVQVDYAVGNSVRIIHGPLEGFIGRVEEVDADKDMVKVTVSMFGRDTLAELQLGQVELVRE